MKAAERVRSAICATLGLFTFRYGADRGRGAFGASRYGGRLGKPAKVVWRAGLLAATLLVAGETTALAGPLRAGAAKASITPSPDAFPYWSPGEKPFVGVHDEIFARALVLDDGERRLAIVSVETTSIPAPEALRLAVAEAAGVPIGNLLLTATHTHSVPLAFFHGLAPSTSEQREIDRVRAGAVQAAKAAAGRLVSARVAFGRGEAFVNTNNGEQAGLKGAYDPKGPSDKTLDLLRVVDASGAPLAVMVNYASHAEVMFRSVTKNGGYEVSGDLPGAVSRLLEGNVAPVVLFTAAAEGDQLPLFKSLQPEAELPGVDMGAAGWALLDLQARRLAAAALSTLGAMDGEVAQARIGSASGKISCPGQTYHRDPSGGPPTRVDTPPVSISLSVIRIGDIALAGIGADIASDIGQSIKSASGLRQTMITTLTAGSIGYVLNDDSYRRPGHAVMGSPIRPGCAEPALAQGVAKLVQAAGQ